jgi:hypothetical protein
MKEVFGQRRLRADDEYIYTKERLIQSTVISELQRRAVKLTRVPKGLGPSTPQQG